MYPGIFLAWSFVTVTRAAIARQNINPFCNRCNKQLPEGVKAWSHHVYSRRSTPQPWMEKTPRHRYYCVECYDALWL